MRKGQLVLFFMIGVLFLIAIMFLYLAGGMIHEYKLRVEAKRQLQFSLDEQGVKNYVEDCIQRVLEQGVITALRQGGRLNISKEKQIMINISGNWTNVTYIVLAPSRSVQGDMVYPLPPEYPYPNRRMNELFDTYGGLLLDKQEGMNSFSDIEKFLLNKTYYSGFLGINNLLPICRYNGSNFRYSQQLSRLPCVDPSINHILDYQPYGYRSLEEELVNYTTEKLPECANLSIFSKILGLNYTVSDEPRINITFSPYNLNVKAIYNFNLSYKGRMFNIMEDFSKRINIPLIHIYNALSMISKYESRDPYFNSSSISYLISVDPLISNLTVYRCPQDNASNGGPLNCTSTNNYDTLLVLEYNTTTIKGQQLRIYVGIENRKPVLDYIHTGCGMEYDGKLVDICVLENRTITIEPYGIDPDELPVSYNYSGWQETYFEYLNFSKCKQYGGSVNCSNISEIREAMIINRTKIPRNWTRSQEFQDTHRSASYKTSHNDTGLHFLEVWVKDPSGEFDYQNVSILVFDLPVSHIEPQSIYSDIPNNWTSIEDPFILNGSESKASMLLSGQLLEFNWSDDLEPFNITTTENYLRLPYPNKGIEGITHSNFTKIGIHNVTLKVIEATNLGVLVGIPDTVSINVTQCVPHRNPNSPAYPYNTINDPFMANHTCCSDDGTYKDDNTVCFSGEWWGYYYWLEDKVDNLARKPDNANPDITENYHSPIQKEDENDIYKLTFKRYCSGDRGNICSGDIDATIDRVEDCDDQPQLPGYVGPNDGIIIGRCSGPPEEGVVEQLVQCVNYTDTTFEQLFETASNHCWEGRTCDGDIFVTALTCENGECTRKAEYRDCSSLNECIDGDPYDTYDTYVEYICDPSYHGPPDGCKPTNRYTSNDEYACIKCGHSWVRGMNTCCGDGQGEMVVTDDLRSIDGCCMTGQCYNFDSNTCVVEGTTRIYNSITYTCECSGNSCSWEPKLQP